MTYSEIVKLLDKGFTPEQIMALHDAPEPTPAPAADPTPAPAADPTPAPAADPTPAPAAAPAVVNQYVEPAEPEWAKKLNENITSMKNAIYAQNIQKDLGGTPPEKSAEDVLLDVLGNNKGAQK